MSFRAYVITTLCQEPDSSPTISFPRQAFGSLSRS